MIKGTVTAAALHPLLPWEEASAKVIWWKPLGEGEKETAFMSVLSLRRDSKTGLAGQNSLLLG